MEGNGDVRIAGKFKGDIHIKGNLNIQKGAHLTARSTPRRSPSKVRSKERSLQAGRSRFRSPDNSSAISKQKHLPWLRVRECAAMSSLVGMIQRL